MDILKKPLITEKQTIDTDKLGTFGFIVDKRANKIEIKKEIEKLYGVHVTDIRTLILPAKAKSRFTKAGVLSGRKGSYKKAIVTIAEGETIDFFTDL
ncbi:MAG: 50S ribosomal protein L23 [Chitinophagales bacterium]|nr:50S ribosomal protein L23 [Chitinophagales bacterium]MCZ2392524.1 50S ribosomal protein L23 [Chitinophagales bacterium]